MTLIPLTWFEQAATRISPYIKHTPLTHDAVLDLYFKWENHQVTGSFKARGALNKVLSLHEWERKNGLVTASAGNHGQGVALAGELCATPVIVFASEHAVPDKIKAMQQLGAEVRLVKGGYGEAEAAGIAYAEQVGATWISPYNDGTVIAGQGTLALEVQQDLEGNSPKVWVVPAGGGGLVSGMGVVLASQKVRPDIIAVQSEASQFLHAIYRTGTQDGTVELDSLADGLAGPVEVGSVTIPLVQKYVTDFVLVNEQEIAQAIAFAWKHYNERIEGSAAVALAAVLTGKVSQRPAVIVITGGNIQADVHSRIVNPH